MKAVHVPTWKTSLKAIKGPNNDNRKHDKNHIVTS